MAMNSDFNNYVIQAKNCTLQGNYIIYHPNNSILNYIILDLVRRHVINSNSHILIVAPSEQAANQQISLLKRQLLTDSISSSRDEKNENLWPSIIVLQTSSLSELFRNEVKMNLSLIIILDCHDAMQDESVIEVMTGVKELENRIRPQLYCFTSCIVADPCAPDTLQQQLHLLKEFYGCKVMQICDQSVLERIFPNHHPHMILGYKKIKDFNPQCKEALQILQLAKNLCLNFHFQFNPKFLETFKSESEIFIKDILSEIQFQMEELGEYGGSTAALTAFRQIVRLYTFADSNQGQTTKHVLSFLACSLSRFRKVLEDDMFRVQVSERAERFSSEKVQLLLEKLRYLHKSQCALIIVNDSHTASILTLVLQNIVNVGKKYTHLQPELMINSSSVPFSQSWEDILSWERNMEVYSRFVSGKTNTLIVSGGLKDIDLPYCDVVIIWDKIEKFSCFLKAKNQMKNESGQLILLTEKSNLVTYKEEILRFQTMESEIKKTLCEDIGNAMEGVETSDTFMTPLGTEVGPENAVAIINRYCESLQHNNKLTSHQPIWEMKKFSESTTLYQAILYLPRSSPVNKVESSKMASWQAAQQNAALQACCMLYKIKELNDIMEVPMSAKLDYELRHLGLNPNQVPEVKPLEEEEILSDIIYPSVLKNAQPKPGNEVYVHTIKIWPVSDPPPPGDNRKTVLYELLCNKSFFAILSAKPLLKVCPFPIFMFGHELTVEVETNDCSVKLNDNELFRIRRFHCGLFMNVLPIVQRFMQFDAFNEENSYFIAPLTADGGIDWVVINDNFSIPESRELSLEEKLNLVCTPETHEKTMVKPWYRSLIRDQVYLVSTVCTDMNAESCFPTDDFDSFKDYYQEKYNIILERPELPLLEVYLINTKVNALLPRTRSHKMRREEKMEDFREHMVPELCMPLLFPAALWFKLSGLPSILHRLSRLLLIEELRRVIVNETQIGALECDWNRLPVNLSCIKDGAFVSKVPPSNVKRGLTIGNVKLEDRKEVARLKKPWKLIQEPVDVYRHIESLNFVEIRYFDEFLIKSKSDSHLDKSASSSVTDLMQSHSSPTSDESMVVESEGYDNYSGSASVRFTHINESDPRSISMLMPYVENQGPQLHELLEVFTSFTSGDTMNMDRIQVLGNSFLKLIITTYAYNYTGSSSSSKYAILHHLRKSFMSKSNLVNCSVRNQLCHRIKVLDFAPGEWTPPSFTTPCMLKLVLKEQEISPSVLQHICLTEVEQLTGFIDPNSEDEILEELTKFVNRGPSRREEAYIDRHNVPYQTAAGCVEALVGTYFKSCGWQSALKVVGWLQLLPSVNLQGLLDYEVAQDRVLTDPQIELLPFPLSSLEMNLQYSFHDKILLLQAITHESYINSTYQGSMDLLAFLGSGILDFVMTCYIYEHFTELSPSQLWRLRELLSSTSTLASLAVRHNIHKYLLSNSPWLLDAIDRFVKQQNGCLHPIDDEVQLLFEEHECETSLQVEVPNVLAMILQSLVGAVYLDSGKNLLIVWETFSRIFLPELGMWRQDVPLSVVELLKDLSPAAHQVIFSNTMIGNDMVQVTCRMLMDNTQEKVFVACGSNEAKTKTHAAKLALRNLLGSTNFSY